MALLVCEYLPESWKQLVWKEYDNFDSVIQLKNEMTSVPQYLNYSPTDFFPKPSTTKHSKPKSVASTCITTLSLPPFMCYYIIVRIASILEAQTRKIALDKARFDSRQKYQNTHQLFQELCELSVKLYHYIKKWWCIHIKVNIIF